MRVELHIINDARFCEGLCRLLPQCGLYVRESHQGYAVDARLAVCEKPEARVAALCKNARKDTIPLFVFSRFGSGIDHVNCLRLGAYRVYGGHFSVPRLVSDLSSLPQRNTAIRKQELTVTETEALWRGEHIDLSAKQLTIFKKLASGSVVHRHSLMHELERETPLSASAVDACVLRLKKRLPAELRDAITSIYGVGFRLELPQGAGSTTEAFAPSR